MAHSDLHHKLKSRLLALPPRAFELFAGDLLEFIGLRDVAVTRYSGDGGIDAHGRLEMGDALISIPTGVQVKRYRNNVGRAEIDRFIGALSGRYPQGIFITTAGYARQASLKAATATPHVATVDGDQVVGLMLQHQLGVEGGTSTLDEAYFSQYEAQATGHKQISETQELYQVAADPPQELNPAEDLITLRALSHALRVDTSTLRRLMEKGLLQPDQVTGNGLWFRRDRIETIRQGLLGREKPLSPEAWREEFLAFARSRSMSKSYKPVLLKALLKVLNRDGEAPIAALTAEFRAFYIARRQAGLIVEYGPPDISDPAMVSDTQLRQLIIKNPLERFLIKGFLEYLPEAGLVRFAPYLWNELRAWELLDLMQSADGQLAYYYGRVNA
jgi:DNA-binding transcriptional MerR regulator